MLIQQIARLPDLTRKQNAEGLKHRIERYWREQGKRVRCWVEPIGNDNCYEHFAVRSDMLNGLPRG